MNSGADPPDGIGRVHSGWIEADPQHMPLGRLLARTGQVLGDYYRRTVSAHGLTATGLGVLGVLADADGLSHRDVAGRLGVTPATLTAVVDRLAADGVVSRNRDGNDRRVVRLWITRPGRVVLSTALDGVAATLRERLPAPSPEQERVVRSYLLAVLAAVDEPRPT